MPQTPAYPKASKTVKTKKNFNVVPNQTPSQNVVVFTSFDGTVREVEDLPLPLGRATALANEKAAVKIWGSPAEEEEAACLAMQKER